MSRSWVVTLGCILTIALAAIIRPRGVVLSRQISVGQLRQGQIAHAGIRLTNSGFLPLRIDEPSASCSCTTVSHGPLKVMHGNIVEIPVEVDTSRLSGPFRQVLGIHTSDWLSKTAQVIVTGESVPDFTLSPATIDLTTADEQVVRVASHVGERVLRGASTDTSLVVELHRSNSNSSEAVIRVIQRGVPVSDAAVIVLETSSELVPELRIPVRRALALQRTPSGS